MVKMVAVVEAVLVFCVVAVVVADAEVAIRCSFDSIMVRWTGDATTVLDPLTLYLGSCPPTSGSLTGNREAFFQVGFNDCDFVRVVTGNQLIYQNFLTDAANASVGSALNYPVQCIYERHSGWTPPMYDPVDFHTTGTGTLAFSLGLAYGAECLPAQSNTFNLGSQIPVCAEVDGVGHMPLVVLMDECVASSTAELEPSSQIYPIVTNQGCLVDGMKGDSSFQRRGKLTEILLSLHAFKFPLHDQVYLHCKLSAWDPQALSDTKKACNYNKEEERWELLDDPSQSAICSCCSSGCATRMEGQTDDVKGFSQNAVMGPFTVVEQKTLD